MAARGLPSRTQFKVKISQHLPAADTAAVVTLAAVAGKRNIITAIHCSYIGTPTVAGITVSGLNDDGAMVYQVDFPLAAGEHQLNFDNGLIGKVNGAVVVTLADPAAAGSTAKLNVFHAQ
jgi:hypothetical protein